MKSIQYHMTIIQASCICLLESDLCVNDISDVSGGKKRHAHILQKIGQVRLSFFSVVLHPIQNSFEYRFLRVNLQTQILDSLKYKQVQRSLQYPFNAMFESATSACNYMFQWL